jgi:hypothetical protein
MSNQYCGQWKLGVKVVSDHRYRQASRRNLEKTQYMTALNL